MLGYDFCLIDNYCHSRVSVSGPCDAYTSRRTQGPEAETRLGLRRYETETMLGLKACHKYISPAATSPH
jgi:hypothetical protein